MTGINLVRLSEIETLKVVPRDKEKAILALALNVEESWLFPRALDDAVESGLFDKRKIEFETEQLELLTHRHNTLSWDGGLNQIEGEDLQREIKRVLEFLRPRDRQVLIERFGLDGNTPKTLEGIAKVFQITRERARQIESKALRKLRHPSRSRFLKEYL